MSSARTRRPLPGLGLAGSAASSPARAVEVCSSEVTGADAEWFSGASVLATCHARVKFGIISVSRCPWFLHRRESGRQRSRGWRLDAFNDLEAAAKAQGLVDVARLHAATILGTRHDEKGWEIPGAPKAPNFVFTCMAREAASSLRRCALTLFSWNFSVTLQNS